MRAHVLISSHEAYTKSMRIAIWGTVNTASALWHPYHWQWHVCSELCVAAVFYLFSCRSVMFLISSWMISTVFLCVHMRIFHSDYRKQQKEERCRDRYNAELQGAINMTKLSFMVIASNLCEIWTCRVPMRTNAGGGRQDSQVAEPTGAEFTDMNASAVGSYNYLQ